jgi:hypothetical protein
MSSAFVGGRCAGSSIRANRGESRAHGLTGCGLTEAGPLRWANPGQMPFAASRLMIGNQLIQSRQYDRQP